MPTVCQQQCPGLRGRGGAGWPGSREGPAGCPSYPRGAGQCEATCGTSRPAPRGAGRCPGVMLTRVGGGGAQGQRTAPTTACGGRASM